MTLSKYNVPAEIAKKIYTAIELKKELAKYEQEIKDALLESMQEYNIKKIDNEDYYVTLVERATYKAENISQVDPDMLKMTLDVKRAGDFDKLNGQLPTGVTKTVTEYIKWGKKNG